MFLVLLPHLSQPFFLMFLSHPLSQLKNTSTLTLSPPTTCQPPLLGSALYAACLNLPPLPASFWPPFAVLGLWSGTCQTLGVRLLRVHPSPLCLRLSFLCYSPTPDIVWFLVSCQVTVFAQGREVRAPPLPGNLSPWYLPPRLFSNVNLSRRSEERRDRLTEFC